jgi:hypothetical protein
MRFPNLLLAVRFTGLPQYLIARQAGIREARLSEIIRRGVVTPDERQALSTALHVPEAELFEEDERFRDQLVGHGAPRQAGA